MTDLVDNRKVFFETRASLCVDAALRHSIDEVDEICRDLDLYSQMQTTIDLRPGAVPAQMLLHWNTFEPQVRPLLIWLLTVGPDYPALLDRLCERLRVDVDQYVSERRPYLSTDEILRLSSDGFTIGAHGRTHRRLQNLPIQEAEYEIVESCRIIHELTGQASVPFAFPYYGGGIDRRWLADIRQQHSFIGLFFDTQGIQRDAPFVVQRLFGERIEETGSIERLLRRGWMRRFHIGNQPHQCALTFTGDMSGKLHRTTTNALYRAAN